MPNITDPITLSPGAALGSAAISGGAGLIGSGLQYLFNKKLAEKQNEYNLNMWKLQAEYNSPQAQMERFRAAGLNPNLIYGQGNNGNMSNAPQMLTPQSPQVEKSLQRLGEAFNIENLRTLVANRKKAQADAQNAQTNADRNRIELSADILFSQGYYFDPTSGKYVQRPLDSATERTIVHSGAYRINKRLAEDYYRGSLIPARRQLLQEQFRFLEPQTHMVNYDWQNYPVTFWIDRGSAAARGVGSIVNSIVTGFSPKSWYQPLGNKIGKYLAPGGKIYNY